MEELLMELHTNSVLQLVCVMTVIDTIFGVLRAWKQHTFNSSFGIDGAIRKIGIMVGTLSLFVVDCLLDINFLPFIPKDSLQVISLTDVGLTEVFGIMFIVYEATSVLKNMLLIGIPIPKHIRATLEKWMENNTEEMKEEHTHERN